MMKKYVIDSSSLMHFEGQVSKKTCLKCIHANHT